MRPRTALALVVAVAVPGCAPGSAGPEEGGRTIVASLYPLAFAAERVAGLRWQVTDLTPPGAEAHDVELSIEDRAALEDADLVVYLGDIGFQPEVERAVDEARGEVLDVWVPGIPKIDDDPHVWLDPALLGRMQGSIAAALAGLDPGDEAGYGRRSETLGGDLLSLKDRYRVALEDCAYSTMIVSHEAFGYLASAFGLRQFGLAGLTPEGEPTADRLAEAERLIAQGRAGSVLYEQGEEAARIAESLAADAGVPALPLSTLEARPADGDYLSVMEENLASLREGLGCE